MKKLIAIIVLILLAVPTLALVKKGSAGGGEYTVVDSKEYPILFIPGFGGSIIDGVDGTNNWPGTYSLTSDSAFLALGLRTDGTSPTTTRQKENGVLRNAGGCVLTSGWCYFPVYQGFYDYMERQNLSYETNEATGKVFFDFPYDWRQDNNRWTPFLKKKVDAVLKETKADKVILVTHSMGVMQARLLLKDEKYAAKVAAVIFLAPPFHGAAMPFWGLTQGYNFDNIKVTNTTMWEIAGNWPAAYQLVADYPILQGPDAKFLPPEAVFSKDWISEQEYNHYLAAQKAGKKYTITYGLPNNKMAKDALAFKRGLGDSLTKYPNLKYYVVRGMTVPTAQYFEYEFKDVGLDKPLLQMKKVVTERGDGTVGSAGTRIQGADFEFSVPSGHGEMPSNASAQAIVTQARKDINREDFRAELARKAKDYASSRLVEVAGWEEYKEDEGEPSVFSIFMSFIVGQVDKEKVKLRDEIRGYIKNMVRDARVTIVIGEGENQDHVYLITEGLGIADAGPGIVEKATFTVTLDSYATFEQVTSRGLGLKEGIRTGQVVLSGRGANYLRVKMAQWFAKYS